MPIRKEKTKQRKKNVPVNSSIDWLIDWSIDWLIDWSIDWLIGPSIDWLIDFIPRIRKIYPPGFFRLPGPGFQCRRRSFCILQSFLPPCALDRSRRLGSVRRCRRGRASRRWGTSLAGRPWWVPCRTSWLWSWSSVDPLQTDTRRTEKKKS